MGLLFSYLRPLLFKLLIGFYIVVLVLYIIGVFYGDSGPEYTSSAKSFGLDNNIGVESVVSGVLFFSARDTETNQVNVYQYDVQNDTFGKLTEFGGYYDFKPLSSTLATAILVGTTTSDDGNEDVVYVPYWINFDTLKFDWIFPESFYAVHNVNANPAGSVIAATVSDGYIENAEKYVDITNWKIVAIEVGTDKMIELEQAARGTWINNGRDMLLIGTEGLMRYHTPTGGLSTINTSYRGLDIFTEIAVSPDDSSLILTIPKLSTIAYFEILDGENILIEEVGRITNEKYIYSNPVFSVDGTHYAVVRTTIEDSSQIVEIRPRGNNVVLQEIIIPTLLKNYQLSGWSVAPMRTVLEE